MTTPTTGQPFTRHTCTRDGKALPFGRKAPEGQCPRCDELRNGAAPREAHPAIQAANRQRQWEAQSLADVREHFASEKHRSGGCGPVCTFGDW
jgi:phage FluMu protein Com